MKKGILRVVAIMCTLSVLCVHPVSASSLNTDIWNGVDLSTNASIYGKAVWGKDVTYHETVLTYSGRNNIKLLYPIDEIISVRSYDLQTEYTQGVDYSVVEDKLYIPQNSSIPVYDTPADAKPTDNSKATFWRDNSHKYQIQITYTHSKTWNSDALYTKAPESQLHILKHFYEKAKSGAQTNVVFYGDSITVGWNASGLNQETLAYISGGDAETFSTTTAKMYSNMGFSSVPEWALETYPKQVVSFLKKQFNNDNITYTNKAIGSTKSSWGSKEQNMEFLLGSTNPDLLFIAYGANESNNSATTQNTYTRKIINYARQLNPNCSIILVSSFYFNRYKNASDAKPDPKKLGEQEAGYFELMKEYDNLIVAPVFSMFESLLEAKEGCDYTSNVWNHPNDFGTRIYADIINAILEKTKDTECLAYGHKGTLDTLPRKAATCTTTGLTEGKKYSCCGADYIAQETEAINPNNHEGTEINVPAKAATCTTAGYTAGKKYDCCGAETLKSTEIKALGHSYKTTVTKATTKANGKKVTKCTRCGNTATTTIAKIKSIKLSTSEYTYSGKAKKPSVTVKDSKGTKLKKDIDYTVSYASGRKNVGKYKVTIKFKGNYSGSKTLYFTINPKKTSVKKVTAGSKKLTVKWSKQKSQATGYEIQYSTSSKFTSKTTKKTTVKSYKTTSKTIKKLKAKKKYYVRIRTYKTVKGKKYYSAWSSKKSKTTKK